MDQYKKIAKEFFDAFEGKQHYPQQFKQILILWFLAVIYAVLGHVYSTGQPPALNPYFLFPAMLLAGCALQVTADHKHKSVDRKFANYPSLDEARISEIKRLLAKDRCDFLDAAQDLMQLMELSKKCGAQPLSTRDLFPLPWAKDQFVMHVLTLAALISTTLGVLFPDTAKVIGQEIVRNYIGHLILSVIGVIFLGLTAFPLSRTLWHNFKRWLGMWLARLWKGPVSSRVHLDYLLENLVRLHEPLPPPPKQRRPTIKRLPPRLRHLR